MSVRAGLTLPELLVVLVVSGLLLSFGWPALATMGAQAATAAGARQLMLKLQELRWASVAAARAHGMLFEKETSGWSWTVVRDGNGNGVRTVEARSGVDPTVSGPHRLERFVEGIALGFPPGGPIPRIPPAVGTLGDGDDPVRFGNGDLVAFGPLGTASSGTLYVTDGKRELFAVVLFGRTGRLRVWRFVEEEGKWKL